MANVQEHAAVITSLSTGVLTALRVLPEVLGCILSLCGIIWYVIQIRYAFLERQARLKAEKATGGGTS